MLHIHNGDSAAEIAKQTSLPGEHIAWRESLITGPTPSGLSNGEWRRVRAAHLSEAYGVVQRECELGLLSQEKMLDSFSEHEEAVLWFEHDLFCQLHLVYLLDRFSRRDLGTTKLSLICIGEFPGKENFRGLGELTPLELESLFPTRQQVTRAQLDAGAAAWRAYCSANPTDIEKLLQADTSDLSFLDTALRAHLQRFPAIKNGLSRIENCALQFIHEGINTFSDLFAKFGGAEPIYGLGDAQFWLALRRMSAARAPLLVVKGVKPEGLEEQLLTPEVVREAEFGLTVLGEQVLNGEADFVALNGIDGWLGGVHLSGTTYTRVWRWDEKTGRVSLAGPREVS